MANAANSIPEKQNSVESLKRLRAQRHLYRRAKNIMVAEALLTVAVPLIGALAVNVYPAMKAPLAFYSLVIAILAALALDPWQRRTKRLAARVQESFDCDVLELPWDGFRVGDIPDEE